MRKLPGAAGRRLRPADRRAAHRDRDRPRRRLAARHLARLIDETLYNAFGQRQVATMYTSTNQYKVMLEVKPEFQTDPTALSQIYVPGRDGAQVPLSTFAKFTTRIEPLTVNHQGQFPAVTLSFNLAPGIAIGQAVAGIHAMERELRMPPTRHRRVPGHRAGLPGVAAIDAAADRGRDPGRLHRAGHALRELHPSRSRSCRRCRRPASARCSR